MQDITRLIEDSLHTHNKQWISKVFIEQATLTGSWLLKQKKTFLAIYHLPLKPTNHYGFFLLFGPLAPDCTRVKLAAILQLSQYCTFDGDSISTVITEPGQPVTSSSLGPQLHSTTVKIWVNIWNKSTKHTKGFIFIYLFRKHI